MSFVEKFDAFAEIEASSAFVKWTERAAFVFMLLMIAAAPHSIAATQIAWVIGSIFLIARLFAKPRLRIKLTRIDAALWAFFGWSVLTSFTSYAPDISIDKLRGVIIFLIFYLVI